MVESSSFFMAAETEESSVMEEFMEEDWRLVRAVVMEEREEVRSGVVEGEGRGAAGAGVFLAGGGEGLEGLEGLEG